MPDRPAATPETYASGPFVSIRTGGPFNGVVTITAVADGNGRVLVNAAWTRENKPQSAARILDSYDTARRAHSHGNGQTSSPPGPSRHRTDRHQRSGGRGLARRIARAERRPPSTEVRTTPSRA